MGKILELPDRQLGIYRVRDLGTRRPLRHPRVIERDRNGHPLPEADQVWAANADGILWVVESVHAASRNRYLVWIHQYGNPKIRHRLDGKDLRSNLRLWDDLEPNTPPRAAAETE